jgi:hypothetical protein
MSSAVEDVRGSRPRSLSSPLVLASLPRRLCGAAIDLVLITVLAGLFVAWLDSSIAGVTRVRIDATTGQRTVDGAWAAPLWFPLAVFVLMTAIYLIPTMAVWGRTLGGWSLGIRCVAFTTGGAPGWPASCRRWVALYGVAGALSFAPVIGAWAWLITLIIGLSPLWDATHRLRGYADHLAGDVVIRVPGAALRS